jgi:hypothetical protein
MTLHELASTLPWGLHDADLLRMEMDWPRQQLTLDVRLQIGQRQETSQRARLVIGGVRYLSISPPTALEDELTLPWVDAGRGFARTGAQATHPPAPAGHFIHWLHFRETGQDLHLCAREAALTWLDPEPVVASSGQGILFPGDEIPDPKMK